MHRRSRKVLICIGCFFIAEVIAVFSLTIFMFDISEGNFHFPLTLCFSTYILVFASFTRSSYSILKLFWFVSVVSDPFPGIHKCAVINIPKYYSIFWLPIFLFDLTLFMLALCAFNEHIKVHY